MSGFRVSRLSWTPVKGTRLHVVDSLELDELGTIGDRRFFVIDERDEMVNAKRVGELLTVLASNPDGTLRLDFPDGSVVEDEVVLGEPAVARFYGEPLPVQLVDGPFSAALSAHCGRALRLVHAGRAIDRGPEGAMSLISVASLARLADEGAVPDIDARRFRMLIEVEGPAAHEEDEWVGRSLSVGEVTVRCNGHVGRCAITTRNPVSGVVDFPTLKVLGGYRRDEETTEPVAFGIYGSVERPGRVRVGDPVSLLP